MSEFSPATPAPTAGGTGILRRVSWERMVNAVEKVRQRLQRAVTSLEAAKVPYAVVGGNAIAAWVSRVDETAVRNTKDVDILIRRSDFTRASDALSRAGFVYRHAKSLDMFLDGPDGSPREAVHVLFASERVKEDSLEVSPDVLESEPAGPFQLVALEALVRMKLTAFRDKDRTHLRDLIEVGLIDSSWTSRFSAGLAVRLRSILDDPEG
jgi:Uncharacterised nucleotidyltransferase